MKFDASLTNLIVYHEQFIGKDNRQLRLLSAQLNENNLNKQQIEKLVSLQFVHTSTENPLFLSSTYNGIENRAHVHFTKLVVILQLEALLSILRFQDELMKKLPKDNLEDNLKKKDIEQEEEEEEKKEQLKSLDENKTSGKSSSTAGKVVKKNGKRLFFSMNRVLTTRNVISLSQSF